MLGMGDPALREEGRLCVAEMGECGAIEYPALMTKRGIITLLVLGAIAIAVVLVVTLPRLLKSEEPDPAPTYVVAIDAGHGGRDPGATADDVLEKDINLLIAKKVQLLVDAEPDLVVKMTRTLDIFVPLEDRIRIAEEAGATIYVSIHINSYATEEAHGVETIVSDARLQDDDAWVLAELLQDAVVEATGARDRGARSQDSYMHRTEMPAASIEVGYLTNPEERERLLDPAYQDQIAGGILAGIKRFMGWKYPPVSQ
ncbi:N-acetylmuramoyl-L-alanine amidase [Candidatus Bipolaricaulota bacterium]|nr:N-acetylmuramoyl-L-alanine amidase [Candidatus Bipolaricaulota bacterium]